MVPIEETEEDMNGTVSGSDEIDDNSGASYFNIYVNSIIGLSAESFIINFD